MNKIERFGNFSSSNIYKLMSKGRGDWSTENVGASFKTYVKEKQREIKLQRSINMPANTRPIIWGKVIEGFVFEKKLSLDYVEMNDKGRIKHPTIDRWNGVPDLMKKDVVCDIKCPSSLIQFCDLIDSFESVESFKKAFPEYYWQLVSNAILTGVDRAELIVYIPYDNELHEIMDYVADPNINTADLVPFQWEWIFHEIKGYIEDGQKLSNVPYLNSKGIYKSMNKYQFKVPEIDKKHLTERVKLAIKT